jgi:hypothetical protein
MTAAVLPNDEDPMMKQNKGRLDGEDVLKGVTAAARRPVDTPDGQETSCDKPAERPEGHATLFEGMKRDRYAKLLKSLHGPAYREAGHAVMAFLVVRRFDNIFMVDPDGGSPLILDHYIAMLPSCLSRGSRTAEVEGQTIRQIMFLLAGPLAEGRFYGKGRSYEAARKRNMKEAEELALNTFRKAGLPAFFAWQEERLKQLFEHPHVWCQVEALAQRLIQHDWDNKPTFSGKDARKICNEAEDAWYRAKGSSKPGRRGPRRRVVGSP